MKNNLFILFSFILISSLVYTQQIQQTNLYEFNKLKLNPAFAGENNCSKINIGHLGQWSRFNGAPQISYVNGSFEVGKNMSLGGKITLDRLGTLTMLNAQGLYSYKLNFGKLHNLSLGLGIGINQNSFDFSGSTIQHVSDPSLNEERVRGSTFYSEFGLVYTIKNFQLSFSIPNIIESTSKLSPTISGLYINKRHMLGYIAYRFGELNKLSLTPSILYKSIWYNNGAIGQHQIEGNLLLNIKNLVQLGFGYRHETAFLGRLGLNINNKIQLGYAYEFATTDLAKVSSGSHEIIFGIKLCNNKELPRINIISKNTTDTVYVENPSSIDTMYINDVSIDTIMLEKVIEQVKLEYTIYYAQSQYTFDVEKEKEGLSEIIEYLKENREKSIYIKGYASEEGSDYLNFKLSGKRAKRVYSYLLSQGVNRNQMISIVQGEVAKHHGADLKGSRTENRRVTVILKE